MNEEKIETNLTLKVVKYAIPFLLPIIATLISILIGIVYNQFQSADAMQISEIKDIKAEHEGINKNIQIMATNIYLICLQSNVKCVKPDNLLK